MISENALSPYLPLLSVAAGLILILGLLHYFLIHREKGLSSEQRFPRQLLMLALTLLSIVIIIVVAPFSETSRNQLLTLFGIALSGVVAFSSTSFVTNFMAAVVLRVTQPFKVGDFVTIGQNFGKVVARGLLDTEIQTVDRALVAIPNSSFTSQSVSVIRDSGVIVTSEVSLGYDVPHSEVLPLLITAAENTGLTDPYVHITELGNFSINYKVSGLLVDVERLLTTRSELNKQILDTIHGAGIEIASPTIARHISHNPEAKIIPPKVIPGSEPVMVDAEEVAFDKARATVELEKEKQRLLEELKQSENKNKTLLNEKLQQIEIEKKELEGK